MTKPKKVPIKKMSVGKYKGETPFILHADDSEGGRMQAEEIAYQKGRIQGLHKGRIEGVYHEIKKRNIYRAQGALFGSCLTGIIIIIITLIV